MITLRRTLRALLVAVLCLFLVLFINTFRLRSLQPAPGENVIITYDADTAVQRLVGLIQIPTVSSSVNPSQHSSENIEDSNHFDALIAYLHAQWPTVFSTLSTQTFSGHAQLLRWEGRDKELEPLLLLAHLDVVPASEQNWRQPPFSGAILDGEIWGRGTLDDKGSVAAILESVAALIQQGAQPERTLLIALGDDEEVGGYGAAAISRYLASENITPWMVLDEGGFVLSDSPLPVAAPVALVGISEKGYLSVKLTASAPGGHSSMPPRELAIFKLSHALERIHAHPFTATLDGPADKMFYWITTEMRWPERVLFSNTWLFQPLIISQLERSPGGNALLRTTQAPTLLSAGVKDNVLPESASAVINFRLHPHDSTENVITHLATVINDSSITLTPLNEATGIIRKASRIDHPAFNTLAQSIRTSFPDAYVAPYLMVGASDARHYRNLSDQVYRFAPLRLNNDSLSLLHGANERISKDSFYQAIQFYANLIFLSNATADVITPRAE